MTSVVNISKMQLPGWDPQLPKRMTHGSSGFDLEAVQDTEVFGQAVTAVHTGLCISMPFGMEAQIRSRSGMVAGRKLVVANGIGTIDCDYTGEIIVLMTYIGPHGTSVKIKKGERFAQLVFAQFCVPELRHVNALPMTTRGTNGFGSTGVI